MLEGVCAIELEPENNTQGFSQGPANSCDVELLLKEPTPESHTSPTFCADDSDLSPSFPPPTSFSGKRASPELPRPSKRPKLAETPKAPEELELPTPMSFHPAEFLLEGQKQKFSALITQLNTLLETSSTDTRIRAKALHCKAQHLQKLGHYQESVESYSQCLELEPHHVGALSGRGESFRFLGDFAQSKRDLCAALELDPKSLEANIHLIALLVDGFSDLDTAKRILLQARKTHPTNLTLRLFVKKLDLILLPTSGGGISTSDPNSPNLLGGHLNGEGVRSMEFGSGFKPSVRICADGLFLRGRRQFVQQKYTQALESFSLAIAESPDHLPSLLCRGNVFRTLANYEKSRVDFQSCLKLDPDFKLALFGLACCDFAEKRFEESLEHLNRLLILNRNFIKAVFLRAEVLRKLKRYQSSLEDFDLLVKIFSKLQLDQGALSSGILKTVGGVFARRGLVGYHAHKNLSDVLEDFSHALSLNPGDAFVFNSLGLIFFETNHFEKAEYYLEEYLKRNPDDIDALITFGRLLRSTQRFEESERKFRRVIAISGRSLIAYYHLIALYLEIGSHAQAVKTIDALLEIHSDERLRPVRESLSKLIHQMNVRSDLKSSLHSFDKSVVSDRHHHHPIPRSSSSSPSPSSSSSKCAKQKK